MPLANSRSDDNREESLRRENGAVRQRPSGEHGSSGPDEVKIRPDEDGQSGLIPFGTGDCGPHGLIGGMDSEPAVRPCLVM